MPTTKATHRIAPALRHLVVPIDALRSHPRNPRRGDLEAITESLRCHGQYRPVVARRATGEVLAGNHVLRAARKLGFSELAATFVEVSEDEATRILLVDNRSSDLGGYDDELLAEILQGLPDLAGTGFDQAALGDLLDELAPAPSEADDELPPPPPEPRTTPGELIRVGEHLLLCGDATSEADVARLMGTERATALFTDPPYGVAYEGRTSERLRIAGDEPAGLEALLGRAFAAADRALEPGAALYVCHPAGPLGPTFAHAFCVQGWRLRQTLVWVKDALVVGHSDYHFRHEPILYGYAPGGGRRGRGGEGWYGDNAQSSVLEIARPRASAEHPTAKPVELIERCLRNSSRRGELVLDPFAGSGATLIACERLGRRARLIEIDPRYCDVIASRYERYSGRRAETVED